MSLLRSLAVAQTCPVAGDVHANVEEHLELARIAAHEGAGLVVFPELSLTGYELGLARELAFSTEDPRLAPLREASSSLAITMIMGAPVRLHGRLYIGALILAPDGVTDVYTKHRLGAFSANASRDGIVPPAEATVFDAGDRAPLVRSEPSVAALAVCADIGRASHPEAAAARGADTYLASMFVIPSEFERDAARLREYAVRHSMTVAMANFGCASGGLAAAGGSSIWSAMGEIVVRQDDEGSGVAVATETPEGWRGTRRMLATRRER